MGPRLTDLFPSARALAAAAVEWMDEWYDADAALLWNPHGAYETTLAAPRSAHMVRETAWYAVGLLLRGSSEDDARAAAAIEAVAALQFETTGAVFHGTFRRFPEEPDPPAQPVEWKDYDPNWRQFVGSALAMAVSLYADRLPRTTLDTAQRAITLAVEGEPPDRVSPAYSNIALMRSWLDAFCGHAERADDLASAVVARFDRHGTFDEYNSPTYYGIDLYALALWRALPQTSFMAEEGPRLEAALWRDVADLYHAGLGNLCGPYDRSYGMDMGEHLTGLAMWIWAATEPRHAPMPDRAAPFRHAHDLCMAPCIALLATDIEESARSSFTAFGAERDLRRTVPGRPPRTVTAWLSPACMAGGADSGGARTGWSQYEPATVHWRLPDGRTGWLHVRHDGVIDARAAAGVLEVDVGPHPTQGPKATVFELFTDGGRLQVETDRWEAPGLSIDVESSMGGPPHEVDVDSEPRRIVYRPIDDRRSWRLGLHPPSRRRR